MTSLLEFGRLALLALIEVFSLAELRAEILARVEAPMLAAILPYFARFAHAGMLRSVVPFGCPKTNGLKLLSVGVREPPPALLSHKGTISKWQINVAALKLAERQRKRKEMEGGRDEAKKLDERVE